MSQALMQSALALRRAGRLAEAADIYSQVLKGEPKHFEALHALGIVRYQGGQLEEAERLIGEAVTIRPNAAEANYNRACLLQKLNRAEEALCAFERAIALKPDYVEALVNRGTVLMDLGRYREALSDFDKAVGLKPHLPQLWNNRASALLKLKRNTEALACCDRALALHAGFADAWRNRGMALLGDRRFDEALDNFDKAVAFDPTSAGGWANRGYALTELGRRAEAIASYDKALGIKPDSTDALYHRGTAHLSSRRFEDAARDFERTLKLDPAYRYARGSLVFSKLCCCDWRGIDDIQIRALGELHDGKPSLAPFECIAISDDASEARAAARIWLSEQHSVPPKPVWRGEKYTHDRIRLAYLSANFHDHAVARLMAGVWENHDRARFETIAISFGPDDGSAMRSRVSRAFERFIEVREKADHDTAALLRGMEVDIAVDLMGYTEESRPGILSHRPVPVQVNYLGYPGTMGVDHLDYILADRIVIPETEQGHYRERVAYLPHMYLPNDSKRPIAGLRPSRAEAGLPAKGFVFSSFNNSYKFNPAVFDVWCRLLGAVEGSVLWLPQANPAAIANLGRETKARGIASERLIFAPYLRSQDEHLARLGLADLFLDTLPYNAHAGACDALWAGVPLLTCLGHSFAGRVAASVLNAVGLPELVTSSLDSYEALAMKLVSDSTALAGLRTKLANHRHTHPLFDTVRFTRNLEDALTAMWKRSQRGEAPVSFAVGDGA